MDGNEELQNQSELADARLGVAEELGWAVAFLAGLVVYLRWDTWLGGVAAAVVAYWLATFQYRRAAAKAEDAYFRQAGLGKYVPRRGESDV
ncbi:hypothetical protein [Ramlibacter sp. AN1133]|uniref:hypothetical protein n=1 Tax=Ramlibacter sp. AN1133 TaxID=3133429 RepID=UPI0030BA8CF1